MIVSPLTKQMKTILLGPSAMIHRSHLSKLLPRAVNNNDLLNPSGGVATHAYFQYRHLHLHHLENKSVKNICGISFEPPSSCREIHCSCSLQNGKTSSSERPVHPIIKAKLEAVKEKLSKNAHFEKYKEKFLELEKTSPKELLLKLEHLDAKANGTGSSNAKSQTKASSKDEFSLNDVMALDRIKDLEREDIMFLWQEFHRNKPGVIGAVMAGSVFDKMIDFATQYPLFLMPLPRKDGFEFIFVQYMNKCFHFTPLLVYQTHKENSPQCLRLIFYKDLHSSKDLVLMRGEFDKNLLTSKDAHIMAVQINFYYGEISESRTDLLKTFSKSPEKFKHLDLIEELKKLQDSHPHLFEFEE